MEAFKAAADRLGESELLRAEFAKINVSQKARWAKPIGMGCGAFAVLFTLWVAPWILFNGQLSSLELELAWVAVALTLLSVLSWGFSYKYLPVVRNPRARMRIAVACGFLSAACFYVFGLVLTNVLVPHMFHPENPVPEATFRAGKLVGFRAAVPDEFSSIFWIGVAVLWALAVAAIPGAIAYGLEEAARRKTNQFAA
jgi:hypothetical protein